MHLSAPARLAAPGARRWVSAAVAVAVVVGLAAGSGGTASAAATPQVVLSDGSLAEQVRAMQALADQVGEDLAKGAVVWETGRARLDVLLQEQLAAQRRVEEQGEELRDAQARVNAVARQAYTHPEPESWSLAMSVDPSSLTRSLENLMILRRLGATRQGAVERLVGQRLDGAARAARANELRRQAQTEQAALDVQLETLQNKANAALAQLQAAQVRLAVRRAEQRARAEAQLAASQRQALGLRRFGSCSMSADGSYANGFLPPEMLCMLRTAPGQQLTAQAAAAFDQLSEAHRAETGSYLCVTDSYRSYVDQISVFARKPSLAATPGRSNHGWGLAIDFCGGIERAGTAESLWMQNNAGRFGWVHPAWAETSGSRPEAWHWEFAG